MVSSFSAEVLKLRKRPATWIIGLLFAAALVLFGYVFTYVFTINASGQAAPPQQAVDQILQSLLPESMIINVLSNFTNFGSALALVLGALAVGSEYGWDTFKVSLTQRPGRIQFLLGKLAAIGVVVAILNALMLGIAAITSYVIASVEDAAVEWPGFGELLEGFAAGWLILMTFAAMGFFFATLFKSSALAITLGLVYLLVLESLFIGLSQTSETVSDIASALPFKNSSDLIQHFGEIPLIFGGAPGEAVEPSRAAITLVIYTVAFLALSVLLFKRRDQS